MGREERLKREQQATVEYIQAVLAGSEKAFVVAADIHAIATELARLITQHVAPDNAAVQDEAAAWLAKADEFAASIERGKLVIANLRSQLPTR
jgi:hypothetical protein